jgi:hypothetical protein
MPVVHKSVQGSIELTLQGYRAMLERQLGLKNIKVFISDNSKEDLKRQSQESPKYPLAKLQIQEVRAYKDVANGHTIARHGWFNPESSVTSSTTLKSYFFPVAIGTELTVAHSDPIESMRLAEQLIILSMTNALNFKLELLPGMSTMVRAEVPDTVSIPLSESDNSEYPGANVLTLQVALYSWIGFSQDVNRASGTVGHQLKLKN